MDTQRLRELLEKATPAPWHAPGLGEVHAENHCELLIARMDYGSTLDPNSPLYDEDEAQQVVDACLGDSDAELCAYMRNALPALLAEIDRLQGALRDALGPADEAMIAAGVETFGGIVGTPENLAKPEYVERMRNSQRKAVISHFNAMAAVRLRGMTGGGAS